MNRETHRQFEISKPTSTSFLPPAMVEETGWDILLALHADRQAEISLERLAAIVSVPPSTMIAWLGGLEQRQLINGIEDKLTGEVRALLTDQGRDLLDRYLSATSKLQIGTHH